MTLHKLGASEGRGTSGEVPLHLPIRRHETETAGHQLSGFAMDDLCNEVAWIIESRSGAVLPLPPWSGGLCLSRNGFGFNTFAGGGGEQL